MKMSVARTLQSIKPHVPMIKFPLRGTQGSNSAVGSMLQSSEQSSLPPNPSGPKPTRSPIASASLETVPLKYRRKPISVEEMEYIERGGPE